MEEEKITEMDMDTSKDRLLVKIRLRRRDDSAPGVIDSMTVTSIRHLSERKLASRDCTLRRAVLIQKALPFLEARLASPMSVAATTTVAAAAEEHPWDRDPPCFDLSVPSASAAPAHQSEGGIMLPSLEDDLDASAYGGMDSALLFHSSEEREHDWFDQECAADYESPSLSSPLSASLGDDDEATPHTVVTTLEQPEVSLASCADSDEEEEEEVVRELFRKYSSSSAHASPQPGRKHGAAPGSSALGKRTRFDEEEDEDESLQGEEEEDDELSLYSALAQAEPLKCAKPSRSASPCGMTRRASVSAVSSPASFSCSSLTVLSLV